MVYFKLPMDAYTCYKRTLSRISARYSSKDNIIFKFQQIFDTNKPRAETPVAHQIFQKTHFF